jgi:alpha-1,6-mannosyltransferase
VALTQEPGGLKTLHLTNAWHAASGGIGTFYRALFATANRNGFPMRLVVPGDSTRTETVGDFGRIYHVAAPLAPLDRNYRMIYPQRFLFPRTAIQRILNEEQPDLVEIAEKYTLPYLGGLLRTRRLPGVRVRPVVIGASHERMDENMAAWLSDASAARRFCRWYMKSIYFPMSDHHVTFSAHTAEELVEASRGHKVRRGIWIASMGVDCEQFTPQRRSRENRDRLLRRIGAEDGVTILLYAGRLSPEKNIMLLLDMMGRLDSHHFRLCIAGSGPLAGEIATECSRRNITGVTCLGHITDRGALADLYANADIFVHPNPREPFGIAPLEAMASGLAVIAPASGGVTSYANETNAWLLHPDADCFASAAMSIRANPAARERTAREARCTAEQHRWEQVTARLLDLYREIAAITRDTGRSPAIPPYAWSTPGDYWGRETEATNCIQNVC